MPLRAADAAGGLTDADIAAGDHVRLRRTAPTSSTAASAGPTSTSAVANAIKSAACANTLFVFAAGNDGADLELNDDDHNAYPCEYHRSAAAGGVGRDERPLRGRLRPGRHAGDLLEPRRHGRPPGRARHGNIWSAQQVYSTLPGWPDGFEGTTAAFNSRWNGRLITSGSKLWNRSGSGSRGSFSLADSPSGNYNNNTQTLDPPDDKFSLAGRRGCRLFYDMRLATEQGVDGFQINAGLTTFASTPSTAGRGRPAARSSASRATSRPSTAAPASRSASGSSATRRSRTTGSTSTTSPCAASPPPAARTSRSRHVDGDAARRRRRRAAPGAQPGADGRAAQDRAPQHRRHDARPRGASQRPPPALRDALNSVADGAPPEGYYHAAPAGEDEPDRGPDVRASRSNEPGGDTFDVLARRPRRSPPARPRVQLGGLARRHPHLRGPRRRRAR